jgi:hypothetical protein
LDSHGNLRHEGGIDHAGPQEVFSESAGRVAVGGLKLPMTP